MPRPLVQAVAGLIALSAVAAFAMGIINAPERGRLPGERAGRAGPGAVIQATDATPLTQERIEAPPPPPKPEEQADDEPDAADQATNAAAPTTNAAAAATNATPAPAASPGQQLQNATPPPDAPPY